MCLFLDKVCFWAKKFFSDVNVPPLSPDEENNFGGSLVLPRSKKWWRHVQPKNKIIILNLVWKLFLEL